MVDIRDSVQNPLDGKRWWLEAEDPWQCLATCYELTKAIDSGNPLTYVSHLPIHQDGTCNGLQHYAALGGDIAGARQVNLEPGDRPADVYTGVAELVKADIKQDAEAGEKLAQALDGKITRKIVKQTVMTNVYGVTFRGATDQVKKQLDAFLPDLREERLGGLAAVYIARKIFKGLGTLFTGAHDIQYWFGDCANRITNSISPLQLEQASMGRSDQPPNVDKKNQRDQGLMERKALDAADFRSTMVWTTPLKLPVVQPYRIEAVHQVKTHVANIAISEPSVADAVDKRKQLQAFPPNFIHSLDATHMMLSALEAHKQGLTFSAVHDSFWTHAADIDALNLLLRDAFIRMHTEDIVSRLAAEFKLRYKGHLYLARINGQSSLGKKIATYRNSIDKKDFAVSSTIKGKKAELDKRRQYHELILENKRQRLLASEDPAEQEKGKNMVTAASIFESNAGEQYLTGKNSLGETALGTVPETKSDPTNSIIAEALEHDDVPEEHDVDMATTLKPLTAPKGRTSSSSALNTGSHALIPGSKTAPYESGRRSRTRETRSLWLWLPLTFKEVPRKGDWDVRRLKDSVYFFS